MRGIRRHHQERLKANRFEWDALGSIRCNQHNLVRSVNNPCRCGRRCCNNVRQNEGPTRKELIRLEQIKEFE